ncbi:hypothetical protein PAHAL_6G263200 [Panicum hallii]|uniref:Uncharacterized protein n=1 Tax=Panicum hallii TaxID=206008 RepID=A0A2S3I3Y7_9POAL|nr:hypothetical protein PAHAL_6G263200 [Panicum hallii]
MAVPAGRPVLGSPDLRRGLCGVRACRPLVTRAPSSRPREDSKAGRRITVHRSCATGRALGAGISGDLPAPGGAAARARAGPSAWCVIAWRARGHGAGGRARCDEPEPEPLVVRVTHVRVS